MVPTKQGIGVTMNLLYISDTPDPALQQGLAQHHTALSTVGTAAAAQALAQDRYGFIVLALERPGNSLLQHCLP